MYCHELATLIEQLEPQAQTRDVARLCLLLANQAESLDDLRQEDKLAQVWQEMGLRLQLATDQHAAMTEELETLAGSDPHQFTPDQIWILLRAIKVQSQILSLYVGQQMIDV